MRYTRRVATVLCVVPVVLVPPSWAPVATWCGIIALGMIDHRPKRETVGAACGGAALITGLLVVRRWWLGA